MPGVGMVKVVFDIFFSSSKASLYLALISRDCPVCHGVVVYLHVFRMTGQHFRYHCHDWSVEVVCFVFGFWLLQDGGEQSHGCQQVEVTPLLRIIHLDLFVILQNFFQTLHGDNLSGRNLQNNEWKIAMRWCCFFFTSKCKCKIFLRISTATLHALIAILLTDSNHWEESEQISVSNNFNK